MKKIAAWQEIDGTLKKLESSSINIEKEIENWIEKDPSLVEKGLTIVGRQVMVDGGKIDLLGIDPNGRWVVVEIKRDTLSRKTVTQAIDYIASLEDMTDEALRALIKKYISDKNVDNSIIENAFDHVERQIRICIVGTGESSDLERMTKFLSKRNIDVRVVTLDVFSLNKTTRLLAREVEDIEAANLKGTSRPAITIKEVLAVAEKNGTKDEIQMCIDATKDLKISVRPWKTSLMFAPEKHKARALFTIWAKRQNGKIKMWFSNDALEEFFPIRSEDAKKILGIDGWRLMSEKELAVFLKGLNELFEPRQ